MKVLPLKKIFFNNNPLKIISLILGYSFWYIASFNQIITISVTVPLYFTNASDMHILEAPETVTVVLQGKRADLHTLEKSSLGTHIVLNKQKPGKCDIVLHEHHLFLPHNISLIRAIPSTISCTIQNKIT